MQMHKKKEKYILAPRPLLCAPPWGGRIYCCTSSVSLSVRPSHATDFLAARKPQNLLILRKHSAGRE